ncbi:MAG: carboxypeptidase M32 [Chitinophagales bacterium]|nr:carboxypeptidase M32 [Chitinophagales bacterium]
MSYELLKKKMYEIKQLESIGALLSWDMEVMMPHGSDRGFRADQSSLINGLTHERLTDPNLEKLVDSLLEDQKLLDQDRKEVSIIKKDIQKSKKLNTEFVERMSKLTSEAYSVWEKAKLNSDFKLFLPSLASIVDMLKEKCDLLGYEDHPYNALMDNFEEGMTVAKLDPLFEEVKIRLGSLINKVLSKQGSKTGFLSQKFELAKQQLLVKDILEFLQVNKDLFRMDISSHPFCTNFHSSDIRMTTRYNENDLMSSIWSAIHESGHGLYEMGLNRGIIGLPSSNSVSLGIHESQSRFWENNIGRSKVFIEAIFPLIQDIFPQQMAGLSPHDLFLEINFIEPSLIRTESDELTYHYHIMIRYEIEKKLISGELKVSEVRDYWNAMYKEYLKLDVPDDANGCLQDVHWSFGGMGYFPTYSLGSFFAAQWYLEMNKNNQLIEQIKQNKFKEINNWHSENIHKYGSLFTSEELCIKATGKPLDFGYFESYIMEKHNLK